MSITPLLKKEKERKKKKNKKCQGGGCFCFSQMDPMFNIKLNQLSPPKCSKLYSK